MTSLPVSIEQYLLESGFSGTEILILKHLLEGGAMTLRELAAKTGKSTGVLDSASKKLLSKGILAKGIINDTPKLKLSSSEAIVEWVREDRKQKQVVSERREKDLEAFMASLSVDVSRADIQHYEGLEGLQQAYMKLLEECGGTMLHLLPVRHTEVEDPLRDFLVQFFRLRHRQKVITRVIAHDTPLGRRYQSRDPFEYRQTLLVAEDVYAFGTEKVVAGDWVGTFNHAEQKAFLIRSKEMAQMEKVMFEAMWKQETLKKTQSGGVVVSIQEPIAKEVEVRTKMISATREFFLSRKSIAAFAICAALSAGMTWGMYRYTYHLNLERLRERAMGIAATAALQFEAEDLDQLRTYKDASKPAYKKVVEALNDIREQNPNVKYAYIMRPTDSPYYWEFVADADSFVLTPQVDVNGDGVLNDQVPPGYLWLDKEPAMSSLRHAILYPDADREPVIDPWGAWISGHAPIKGNDGSTAAVLGIDWQSAEVINITSQSFAPLLAFLTLFLTFLCVRFIAANRSLVKDFLRLSQTKFLLVIVGLVTALTVAVSYAMYLQTLGLIKEQSAQRLKAIAAATAMQIDYRDLETLRFARDMKRPEYQKVFEILNKVRAENSDIKWAFVLRPTDVRNIWEFVVDADANYNIPPFVDDNYDGEISESEENIYPGFQYDISNDPNIELGLNQSVAANNFHSDQWGTYISGYAPIKDRENNSVAIIGFDIKVTNILEEVQAKMLYNIIGLFVFGIVLLSLNSYVHLKNKQK